MAPTTIASALAEKKGVEKIGMMLLQESSAFRGQRCEVIGSQDALRWVYSFGRQAL